MYLYRRFRWWLGFYLLKICAIDLLYEKAFCENTRSREVAGSMRNRWLGRGRLNLYRILRLRLTINKILIHPIPNGVGYFRKNCVGEVDNFFGWARYLERRLSRFWEYILGILWPARFCKTSLLYPKKIIIMLNFLSIY